MKLVHSQIMPRNWRLSFRVTVLGMFLIATGITATLAVALQYHFSLQMARQGALMRYRQSAARTRDYVAMMNQSAQSALKLLVAALSGEISSLKSHRTLALFAVMMRGHPAFYGVYLGFSNGDLFDLINLDSGPNVRRRLDALPQDRWVLLRIRNLNGKHISQYSYYNAHFELRATRTSVSQFYSNKRPWYQDAAKNVVHETGAYLFRSSQRPGRTYSIRLKHGVVLAADVALTSLSARFSKLRSEPGSKIYLYRKGGQLLASNNKAPPTALNLISVKPLPLTATQKAIVAKHPLLTVSNLTSWPPFDYAVSGQPQGYSVEMLKLVGKLTGLKFAFYNGPTWPDFVRQFRAARIDILESVLRPGDNTPLGIMSKAYAHAAFGVLERRGSKPIHSIDQLFGKRVAIPRGWSIITTIHKQFPKVHVIAVNGVSAMYAAVRSGSVDAGIDTAAHLRYTKREFFYDNLRIDAPLRFGRFHVRDGLHYAIQPSLGGVARLINTALSHVTPAERLALRKRWLNRPQQAFAPGTRATVPYPQLIAMAHNPSELDQLREVRVDGHKQFLFAARIAGTNPHDQFFAIVTPARSVYAQANAAVAKAILITAAFLLLIVPLVMWLASVIVRPVKRLAIEEGKIRDKRYSDVKRVESHIIEIDDLATTQLEMAQAIQGHAQEQEALMDAFIQLIAEAIDDKSRYTGDHCARVPELAMMLARQASASDEPPFKDFRFEKETEWREFRIGAWLHDCGKITTPEHIIDKGTKLETIYNRIHEIRTRFEVLWRDALVDFHEARWERPQAEPELRTELQRQHRRLQEQFAFIASCNQGSEHMSQADMARLEQLAEITWERHFDDRLGLSPVEAERFPAIPKPLPATEKLIADKAWHCLDRTENTSYPARFGIKMKIPALLHNRGELYNLKIRRGTLTEEDRFKINEHIISTIRMLDSLPLPQELSQVPRYASTHHETLDGRGYPRKLTSEDLSVPERIMALADVFEALTAADRPYKKAKPISVAIEILHRMVLDNHLDRNIFELFLSSGVYLTYARRFLPDTQIDSIELERYLSQH